SFNTRLYFNWARCHDGYLYYGLPETFGKLGNQRESQQPREDTRGVALLTLDLSSRPKKTVELRYREQKCTLTALLDTGADSSIVSPQSWPQGWPVQASTSTITGVGGMTLASKSPLLTVVIDNRRLNAVFSIVQLPPTEQPFTEQINSTNKFIQQIQNELHKHHLVITPEKIQRTTPWKYLGWTLTEQIITPQKLKFHTEITTLQDAQKLLGDLQWLRPVVGIPNELLEALRHLLKGTDPAQPVTLTVSQQKILQQIADCVTRGQLRRRSPDLPIDFSTLELLAVVWAMLNFKGPLNVVTDSLYVAGVVERIEDAAIRQVQNQRLFELFIQL
ncbi:hypothetical protein DV515_00018445, partial [Chloebia gouldiae]